MVAPCAIISAAVATAALESVAQSHRGRGLLYQAFQSILCAHVPAAAHASRLFRMAIHAAACWWPQKRKKISSWSAACFVFMCWSIQSLLLIKSVSLKSIAPADAAGIWIAVIVQLV